MKNYKILVTNDDGIGSPGLLAAAEAVQEFGEIIVIAPSTQQTAMGRSLQGNRNAALQPIDYKVNGKIIEAYHCDCAPAILVRHSLDVVFQDRKPDMIVSGINYGENIGATITSSGTVGAAMEGATFGVPSIAVSKETNFADHKRYTEQNWNATKYFLNIFAGKVLENKLPDDVDVIKIDVPESADISTPWKITRQSKFAYYSTIIDTPSLKSKLGDGKIGINENLVNVEKDSDIYAFSIDKVVSVTPISIDLTSRIDFDKIFVD